LAQRGTDLQALQQHASGLDAAVNALRASWSWKLTAPLRGAASLFRLRPGAAVEQRLYRLYYAIPGLTPARNRAAVLFLHKHAPSLMGHTLAYQLYAQTQELIRRRTRNLEDRKRLQRMDEPRAASVLATLANPPLISIVMPVYNVERRWLSAAVDSVRRQ